MARRAGGARRVGGVAAKWLMALALVGGAAACKRSQPEAQQQAPTAPEPPVRAEITGVVERLASADKATRDAADGELEAIEKKGISVDEGRFLLRAAGRSYPPAEIGIGSTQADLIRVAATHPHPSHVAIVREVFQALDPDGRRAALMLLADIEDRDATVALVDLFEATVADKKGPTFVRLPGLEKKPRFAEVLFPRLLKSATSSLGETVLSLCLAYVNEGVLPPADLAPHAGLLLEAYRPMQARLAGAAARPPRGWSGDPEYGEVREGAALLLDVLGHVPTPEVEAVLAEAAKHPDPRIAYFGAKGLLQLGKGVEPAVLERVAGSAEMRAWLFEELARQKKSELFPQRWATQPALAEAEMVKWLVYPTELGSEPDGIELMQVVSEDVGAPDGLMDWYLFRFRSGRDSWAKSGWMAGVAGPFRRSAQPTTDALGDTFSKFTPWDSKKPAEHVAEVRALIREHAEAQRGEPSKK